MEERAAEGGGPYGGTPSVTASGGDSSLKEGALGFYSAETPHSGSQGASKRRRTASSSEETKKKSLPRLDS